MLRLLAEEELGSRARRDDRRPGRVASPRLVLPRLRARSRRARAGAERRRRLAQLVAVCDVYTWKLLRRDAGLSRRQMEIALVELLEPLHGGTQLMASVLAYTSPARGHLFPVTPILEELRAPRP